MKQRRRRRAAVRRKPPKPTSRISLAGWLLIIGAFVGGIFGINKVIRAAFPQLVKRGEIIVEGDFADTPKHAEPVGDYIISKDDSIPVGTDPQSEPLEPGDGAVDAGSSIFGHSYIPAGCVAIEPEQKDIHSGALLRLDSENVYIGSTGALTDLSEMNDCYCARSKSLSIKSEVVTAMNAMAKDWQTGMHEGKLMIYSTTEPYDVNGSLYPEALPDRATGYCVDLCILNEDGTISRIGSDTTWLADQAWHYGFILPYTEAEQEATGITPAPYHLRYVGKEHAAVMHDQGLTLTAYIAALRKHPVSEPYIYNDGSNVWSIYFTAKGVGKTTVAVPMSGDYVMSGNNTDGFIVVAAGRIGS